MIAKALRNIGFIFSAFIAIISFSNPVLAEISDNMNASPYVALERTGTKLFSRIQENQEELKRFPDAMRTIIEEELMPMIDYRYAAYKILGTYLRKTTSEQRDNFADSMRQYLIRTYANALNSYSDQKVIYETDRTIGDKKIISVNTTIVAPNKPDINITFMMRKNTKTQEWKAYDMVVEGISLLSSKKAELTQRISQKGLDQVTLELASIAK